MKNLGAAAITLVTALFLQLIVTAGAEAAYIDCTLTGSCLNTSSRTLAGRGAEWISFFGGTYNVASLVYLNDDNEQTYTADTDNAFNDVGSITASLSGNLYAFNTVDLTGSSLTFATGGFLGIADNATLTFDSFTGANGTISYYLGTSTDGLKSGFIHVLGDVNLAGATFNMVGANASPGQEVQLMGCNISDWDQATITQGWALRFVEGGDNDQLYATAVVPEPSTVALLGLGMAGLAFIGIRRRMRNSA